MSDVLIKKDKKFLLLTETWVLIIAFIGIIVAGNIVSEMNSPKDSFQKIIVEDYTKKVDPILVEKELKKIKTHEDINVLVYAKNGQKGDNLNEDTLNYVRDKHPELITGDKWTDGWFIVSLNIESGDNLIGSGQVGTYYGENIKLVENEQLASQKAGYISFKKRDWSNGLIKTAEYSAKVMAQPFPSPFVIGFTQFILFAAVIIWYALTKISRHFKNKALIELSGLNEDIDQTMRTADNVLVGEYVERVRQESHKLLIRYTDMLDSIEFFKKLNWATYALKIGETYKSYKNIDDISDETDLVSKTITLYEHDNGWEDIWQEQTADTRESINEILNDSDFWAYQKDVERLQKSLEKADSEMYSRKVDVDKILKDIDKINKDVSEIVEDLMLLKVQNIDNDKERGMIEDHINREAYKRSTDNRNIFSHYSTYTYYTPTIFYAGYASGQQSYEASQSSSTSGYGGSGGGFSGSGSSSSF